LIKTSQSHNFLTILPIDMSSSALIQAWNTLPEDTCIANYGGDLLLKGKRVAISHFGAYTEEEKLEALNNLISSKHCLVIAPSACGTFVWWSEGKNGKTKNSPAVRSD